MQAVEDFQPYLLAAREAVDPEAASVLADLLAEEAACDGFLEFARQHLLGPTLYVAVDRYAPLPTPGARLKASLEQDFQRQSALHGLMLSCLDDLAARFSSRGIEFLVMKGPVYAKELYGDLDARHYGDLDMLVREGDAAQAKQALMEMGFVARVHPFLPDSITRKVEHSITTTRGELKVDIHHALRTRPAYRIDADRLWRTTRRCQIGATGLSALSEEYEIVFAILCIAHDLERRACRAKILLDLYLLLLRAAPQIDWDQFCENRRRENLFGVCVNVLAVLSFALGPVGKLAELESRLSRHADILAISEPAQALRILDPQVRKQVNRQWFARVYPGRPFPYRLWLAAAFFASDEFPANLKKVLRR